MIIYQFYFDSLRRQMVGWKVRLETTPLDMGTQWKENKLSNQRNT